MRSFLECSLKAYFEETGKEIGPRRGQYVTLDRVLRKFLAEMKGDKNQTLAQVTERILGNSGMTAYSAQFLNATNHNPDVFVTPEEVEIAMDAMLPIFRYILDPPKMTDDHDQS